MKHQCSVCQQFIGYESQLCCSCSDMLQRIKQQNRIAEKAGTAHDLTLAQWLKIVRHFQGRCAYCGGYTPYLFIEHFLPVTLGGGTTKSNCIPSCHRCNNRKRNLHPDQVKLIPQEALERVRVFLNAQKS